MKFILAEEGGPDIAVLGASMVTGEVGNVTEDILVCYCLRDLW